MTQNQIKSALEHWRNLSDEQRDAARADILEKLARVDNLPEIAPEIAEKLNGGIGIKESIGSIIEPILFGIILPDYPPKQAY